MTSRIGSASSQGQEIPDRLSAAEDGGHSSRPLAGKVAVLTGSTSGIGRATAVAFARRGAKVVLNSVSSGDEGRALAAQLPEALYVQGSVTDPRTAAELVDAAIDTWGGLHYLINNAGVTELVPLADLDGVDASTWGRIMDVNVIGAWGCIQHAVPRIRESGGGSIVNVTSLAGARPLGSSVPYAASKAAMNHVTRLLASVLGPEITVNAVAPGLIATPWTEDWQSAKSDVEARAPAGRVGTPEDVAEACLALVQLPYVTGNVLMVDGGLHLR